MYGLPVDELQERISSWRFTELKAAARLGLVPDPARQSAVIAAAAHNAGIVAGQAVAAAFAGEPDAMPDAKDEDDFILKERKNTSGQRTENDSTLSAAESERRAAAMYG